MEIFCTYCSKEKDELIKYLPAIHRYKSKRIRKVNESAKLLGFPMYILSGLYGLISADRKIRYYDHLLLNKEVDDLVNKKIVNRIVKNKIEKIYFFRNSSDPKIKPYIRAISKACNLSKTKITFLDIDIGDVENVSTNGYREIWYLALKLNQKMVLHNDISGKYFDDLFIKYPNDGMLFYERAEAYECLGLMDKAKNDYEKALFYFPNPKWKKVAYEGLKRIQNRYGSQMKKGEIDQKWNFFHQVNSFVYVPHEIRSFSLSSLERFGEEKRLAIGELRICLEMVVYNLSKKNKTIHKGYHSSPDIAGKLNDLKEKGSIGFEISVMMNRCWLDMGEIIHPVMYTNITDEFYEKILKSFIGILEICNDKKLLSFD
jgi:tetratricopeptide (TPR) repeat protein